MSNVSWIQDTKTPLKNVVDDVAGLPDDCVPDAPYAGVLHDILLVFLLAEDNTQVDFEGQE